MQHRLQYKQVWREGEKTGKISILRDIFIDKPHRGHLQILESLAIERSGSKAITRFKNLYLYWQKALDTKVLNEKFYKEISAWYYYAIKQIKLPVKPSYYQDDTENVKNFTVRLISRMIFCWFLKERKLIDRQLLELEDFDGSIREIFGNESGNGFNKENSYYRGILQNIFFTSLNKPINDKDRKAFFGKQYLPIDFQYDLFEKIPFLNGGLFDKLEEDNGNDVIDDKALRIPNELFYAEEIEVQSGKKVLKTRGINRILSSYKFTIAENTPLEEEVALDPELLGLVFENLLAEIDPDDNVAKSARKESGSFYTPRKVIEYMINESLLLYFKRHKKVSAFGDEKIKNLIYHHKLDTGDKGFCKAILLAIDEIKVLDPACGSGAFPMGVLSRLVEILGMVDKNNTLWIDSQLEKIVPELREKMRQEFEKHDLNYARKLGLIRNAIYGIDIQPLAIMISKLRFFISLLVEQIIDLNDRANNYHISALPNLETKIICANSLNDASMQLDVFKEQVVEDLLVARDNYYNPEIDQTEKNNLVAEIAEKLDALYPYHEFAAKISKAKPGDVAGQKVLNIGFLKEWFKHASLPAPFFNPKVFFPEIKEGFHIVIGNPPYGGTKIDDSVRKALGIESKDPYGAFIARFLGDGQRPTALSYQGVLSLIVSDTFMTIKTHRPLRKQMMRHYIHKMVRVHPDTFKATVNTAIIFVEKNEIQDSSGKNILQFYPTHRCLMADLTQVSIHENYNHFLQLLYKTTAEESPEEELNKADQSVHTMQGKDWTSESSEEYGIYTYPQQLIATNNNLPFFVANPKLFAFMNDPDAKKVEVKHGNKQLHAFEISFNNTTIEIVKLSSVGAAPHGISTGNNSKYIRAKEGTRGGLPSIEEFMIYKGKKLAELSDEEKIKGLNNDWKSLQNCFIPLEKGGESDSEGGWLPNYHVPTPYYINWAKGAINDMRKNPGFRWFNTEYFFRSGLTFSISGIYAPTFRMNSGGVFEAKGSGIFCDIYSNFILLGILASKLGKYLLKNYIKHSVDTSGDDIAKFIFVLRNPKGELIKKIDNLVSSLVKKQQNNPRYDYASNEQLVIDMLVYKIYEFNEDDIQEVENWYARRYTGLVLAQKENLRRLGKPTDYLKIYRALREQDKVPQ